MLSSDVINDNTYGEIHERVHAMGDGYDDKDCLEVVNTRVGAIEGRIQTTNT